MRWLGLLCLLLTGSALAQPFHLASFNVHYLAPGQDDLRWSDRREAVVRVIEEMDAEVLAFQEMETFAGGHYNTENRQLDWVRRHFPRYAVGAYGDAADFPITQPILFDRQRFELLDQGWFFYSDTPEQIYSRTFNGSYPAFTTWVLLREKSTGRRLRVVNNHLDYSSGHNRRRSAQLIVERLAQMTGDEAVVLVGDFNVPAFWPPMGRFKAAGFELLEPDGATFHFNRGWSLVPAIDHILIGPGLIAEAPLQRFDRAYDGVYPSDHYPVRVALSFSGKP